MTAEATEVEIGSELPTALYRLYDADGQLLYVGISADLRGRFSQHASTKPWWGEVGRKTVTWQESRAAALAAEAESIAAERPKYNIQEMRATLTGKRKPSPFSFRPPRELRTWLEAHAEATGRSAGAIITEALTEYRERLGQS